MGSRRKRRSFRPEYKAEVVKLAATSGKSPGPIARELDPTETAVRSGSAGGDRRRQRAKRCADDVETRGTRDAPSREQDAENGARDLEKATVFFAKETT